MCSTAICHITGTVAGPRTIRHTVSNFTRNSRNPSVNISVANVRVPGGVGHALVTPDEIQAQCRASQVSVALMHLVNPAFVMRRTTAMLALD